MSTDGTIRQPDGTVTPLILSAEDAPDEVSATYSYRDDEPLSGALQKGLADLRARIAEQNASDNSVRRGFHNTAGETVVTFPISRDGVSAYLRPTVGEPLTNMSELRTDVDLMELQDSIRRVLWQGFRQGAFVGAAATLGLGVVWALLDRAPWRT